MTPTLEEAYQLIHGDESPPAVQPSVLVVEDDFEILSSVAERIRDEGFHVLTAGNGRQALDQIAGQTVSLILLDLKMPEMDGVELMAKLRLGGCTAPLVLVSAATDLAAQAALLHADAFLAKPFSLEDIVRVTREYCAR